MNTLVRMNEHFSAGERRLQDQVVALTSEREALILERDQLHLAMRSEQGEHGEFARKVSLGPTRPILPWTYRLHLMPTLHQTIADGQAERTHALAQS